MGNSNRRHVVPDPDGGWEVTAPDAERASAHTDTSGRLRATLRRVGRV